MREMNIRCKTHDFIPNPVIIPHTMNLPFRTEDSWWYPDPALRAGLL